MPRIIGTIGATLVVVAALATSATPASAAIDSSNRQLVDNLDIFILPSANP
jgi:hypothetical protein